MCDSGQSPDVSVCDTGSSMKSLSVCQLHDSSVCHPKCDSTWKSIQPSAKFMVKIPTSIPGPNSLKDQLPGNSLPSIHHQICLSIHQAVCQVLCHHQLKTH